MDVNTNIKLKMVSIKRNPVDVRNLPRQDADKKVRKQFVYVLPTTAINKDTTCKLPAKKVEIIEKT